MVEYAILLAVVIAALLIMQVFVKRGFQGGLKDSADKMGEQFSAGGTTIFQERSLDGSQTIKEEVGTTPSGDGSITNFLDDPSDVKGTVDKGAYSYNERSGGAQTSQTKTSTDSASAEKTRWGDYTNTDSDDFSGDFTGYTP